MSLRPSHAEDVQAAVKDHPRLLARGGGSKTALSAISPDSVTLDLSGLSGLLEYQPEELTFTALAGTPVAEVEALLAGRGQYLPFDPVLSGRGATLGGTVAAGLSGPGRQRYGGVRDFLIGARFVNGEGELVRGGARVVKNAAGFDLPKLMVGSLGSLGVLVELTFKVFPVPEAYATLAFEYARLEDALADLYRLVTSPLELHALDLEPAEDGRAWTLWTRLGGLREALPARLDRLRGFLLAPRGGASVAELFEGAAETELWRRVKDFSGVPPDWALVKVPLTPKRIVEIEQRTEGLEALRRYSAGGNVVWLACPVAADSWPMKIDALLTGLELSGLAVLGPSGRVRLGVDPGAPLALRVKRALDPNGRFPALISPGGS
jgi:glycolate oxidase FAD binding subunit